MYTNYSSKDRTIWQMVQELLFTHECVIVPSFGGFVVNSGHAYIERGTKTIYPSWRKVSFNARLRLNDGILAMYVSDVLGIPYTESVRLIDSEVQQARKYLSENRRLVLEGIGSFSLSNDDSMVFTPKPDLNMEIHAYGLGPVRLQPRFKQAVLAEETISEVNEIVSETAEPVRPKRKEASAVNAPIVPQRKRKAMTFRIVASTLILILIVNAAILLSHYPVRNLVNGISRMSMVGFDTTEKNKDTNTIKETAEIAAKPTVETTESNSATQADSSQNIVTTTTSTAVVAEPTLDLNAHTQMDTHHEPLHSEALVTRPETDSVYFIITGAFRSAENARKYCSEQMRAGFTESEVFEPGTKKGNRLHLVSIRTIGKRQEAESARIVLKERFPDSWILVQSNN